MPKVTMWCAKCRRPGRLLNGAFICVHCDRECRIPTCAACESVTKAKV